MKCEIVPKYTCFSERGGKARFLFRIAVVMMAAVVVTYSQGNVATRAIPAPVDESFEEVIDLITLAGTSNDQGIYGDTVRLYSPDGSLWVEYSLLEEHPLYHAKMT